MISNLSCKKSNFDMWLSSIMFTEPIGPRKSRPVTALSITWNFQEFSTQTRKRPYCWPTTELGRCGWKWFELRMSTWPLFLGLLNWYPLTKWLQLIWSCSTIRFSLLVPDIHMNCSDFTSVLGYQYNSLSKGHQTTCPLCYHVAPEIMFRLWLT